jgi:Tfp pilus assembly protein PilV
MDVETKDSAGFSVVELLVALLVTSFVVLGFSASTLGAVRNNRKSGEYTAAMALAQDKLEEIRAAHANGTNPTSGGPQTLGVYTRTWTSPDPDVTAVSGTSTVRMVVSALRGATVTVHARFND